MADGALPSSVADERFRAIDELFADRLAALPITRVLVYALSQVHASALPVLAWQFGALGSVWQATLDEEAKRALISRTLVRRRHRGTHFAVRDALEAAGLVTVVKDALPIRYDGQFRHTGDVRHSPPPEYVFWVVVAGEPSPESAAAISLIVNEWQRLSSRFEVFWVSSEEELNMTTEYHAVA